MGEGRRDRSSKRRRSNLGIEKSSSDTEVVRSNAKDQRKHKKKKREKWHFIEGLTVDELARYRRRRVHNYPKDTLGTYEKSTTREYLVTEYRRAFRATSEDSILGDIDKNLSHTLDNFEPVSKITRDPVQESFKVNDTVTMETAAERAQNIEINVMSGRPPLMRRGTSLRREGDEFYSNTEYSNYVPHEGNHRPDLARRSTSLKMEGDMATTTEQCENFIEWLNVSRPVPYRLPSNLKLEGPLETTTENIEKYVPFVGARRPELLRQKAHLKLEGEPTFLPEYTDVFRAHNVSEKQTPVVPESHLHAGGNFYEATESSRINQPEDEAAEDADLAELRRRRERDEERQRKKEEDMKALVSKLEELKGPPLEVPEYKDSYKDFPRERPKLVKPEDEIGLSDGTKISTVHSPSRFQTKIDQDPEYNVTSLNADRPVYRKPPVCLKASSSASHINQEHRMNREQFNEATSEIRSQYVPYGNQPRVESLRMPANLRLEGKIDLQPEYREAYCSGRDNFVAHEPRMHRRRDRSLSASRRKDNLWFANNNGERFGSVNAGDEQDAFQVLNTRVHEDNVVPKSHLENRRASRLSYLPGSTLNRPTHLEVTNCSPISRNRSCSPGYRLRNVDGESRGFTRRRSSQQMMERDRISSPSGRINGNRRSYSPSFGRVQTRKEDDEQAFVVLNPGRNSMENRNFEVRSRNVDNQNLNATHPTTRIRARNTTPTNWMPPWYDNTKTI